MAMHSGYLIYKIFEEAGLPAGVIQFVPTLDAEGMCKSVFAHKEFASLHFTGSTKVFKKLWRDIGNNIDNYRSYPRIVGETGAQSVEIDKLASESVTQAARTIILCISPRTLDQLSSRLFELHSSIKGRSAVLSLGCTYQSRCGKPKAASRSSLSPSWRKYKSDLFPNFTTSSALSCERRDDM